MVETREGQALAEEYGVAFFETSALTGKNVEEMFLALAGTIKRKRIDELKANGGAAGADASGNATGGAVDPTQGNINLGGPSPSSAARPSCC